MPAIKTISILGCGWLGLPLTAVLCEEGYRVKASTTRIERFAEIQAIGAEPFLLKAGNGNWVGERVIDFLTCDMLIIAVPPGTKRNLLSTHATEVKVLMALIPSTSTIEKILYISSTSVYKNSNKIVSEDEIKIISDAGNKVLFEAEQYLQHADIAANKIILRLGGLTGYDRMLARFFAGKTELAGGNEPVNLLHRDDAIGAILFLIKKELLQDKILNVCSPQHPTREAFYTQLCNRFNLAAPLFSEALHGDWKKISSDAISQMGYQWLFPDPYAYSYAHQ
jgi:nucleoside-diphosphate-sugar epimerase